MANSYYKYYVQQTRTAMVQLTTQVSSKKINKFRILGGNHEFDHVFEGILPENRVQDVRQGRERQD